MDEKRYEIEKTDVLDQLYRKPSVYEYVVQEKDENLTVKEILKGRLNFSSRLLRKLKTEGGVRRNGEPVKLYLNPVAGDLLSVTMPEETSYFVPEHIPFNVVMEDEDILVIDKPSGYVVHPTRGHPTGTMANGIMYYMIQKGVSFKIRFVNRLDRDTTGLLIVGKNSHCQDNLMQQMKADQVEKKYIAVTKGIFPNDKGTIDLPIGRISPEMVNRGVMEDGYPSVTHYTVIKRFSKGYSMVELSLETGRTHQIRVHLSHIGFPIVGDSLYHIPERDLIDRQALHAKSLSFRHPATNEFLYLESPLPDDIAELLLKLGEEI